MAMVTTHALEKWLRTMFEVVTKKPGCADIFEHPERIGNCDETNFRNEGETSKVLVLCDRYSDHVHRVKSGDRNSVTAMLTANAAGQFFPPFFVYKGNPTKQIDPAKYEINHIKDAVYCFAENGYMTYFTFQQYVVALDKWLTKARIQRPFLLILDGHASHLFSRSIEFCKAKNIILYLLEANSTEASQPMDLSVMKSMKSCWGRAATEFHRVGHATGASITQKTFGRVFAAAWEELNDREVIKGGFRKSGIYPFDPMKPHENVDYLVGREGQPDIDEHVERMGIRKRKKQEPAPQPAPEPSMAASMVPYIGSHTASKKIHNIQVITVYAEQTLAVPVPKAVAKKILKHKVSYFSLYSKTVGIFEICRKF